MDIIEELEQIMHRVDTRHLEKTISGWRSVFDERQRRLIANCCVYADNDPAGLPGHNLMLIIAQMAEMLDGRA